MRNALKRQVTSTVQLMDSGAFAEGYSATIISESLSDTAIFDWSSPREFCRIESTTISASLLDPFVAVVDELPSVPITETEAATETIIDKPTSLQSDQIKELFEIFLESGMSRDEALEKLGPLASEITKYKHSFVVSEFRWPVRGFEVQLHDRAFMAPIKK